MMGKYHYNALAFCVLKKTYREIYIPTFFFEKHLSVRLFKFGGFSNTLLRELYFFDLEYSSEMPTKVGIKTRVYPFFEGNFYLCIGLSSFNFKKHKRQIVLTVHVTGYAVNTTFMF